MAAGTDLLLPRKVDVKKLYDHEANDFMWAADNLSLTGSVQELYMTNDNVRQGIAAMLVQDRAKEELHRLTEELKIMAEWMTLRFQKIKEAIESCTGEAVDSRPVIKDTNSN